MQTIYAFNGDETMSEKEKEKFLVNSMERMYDLYLVMLSLLTEVHRKSQEHLKKVQQKHLATQQEKNPNRKFINNRLLTQLSKNQLLRTALDNKKLNVWELDEEYVDVIFRSLLESKLYENYMTEGTISYYKDQEFLIEFYKTIVAPNDKLYDYLEDKNLTWIDDLPVVNTTILKLLRKAKSSSSDLHFLPDLFKDIDDREFGRNLLKLTTRNTSNYDKEISEKTQNWDKDRITNIDLVLLQMAICEFQEFTSIPVKVTINEYLEVAKEYSTPKSSIFINGILDNLVKEYSDKGTLNKTGRGLL